MRTNTNSRWGNPTPGFIAAMAGSENRFERASVRHQQQLPTVSAAVVKKLLQLRWKKDKKAENPKINPDAVRLAAEYLRLFVKEAHQRAQMEAELEKDDTLEPQHIERIMLGMMLDF